MGTERSVTPSQLSAGRLHSATRSQRVPMPARREQAEDAEVAVPAEEPLHQVADEGLRAVDDQAAAGHAGGCLPPPGEQRSHPVTVQPLLLLQLAALAVSPPDALA